MKAINFLLLMPYHFLTLWSIINIQSPFLFTSAEKHSGFFKASHFFNSLSQQISKDSHLVETNLVKVSQSQPTKSIYSWRIPFLRKFVYLQIRLACLFYTQLIG